MYAPDGPFQGYRSPATMRAETLSFAETSTPWPDPVRRDEKFLFRFFV